jgi:hypothetical protein
MKLFQCSIFSWSLCHFYEIIRLLLCFYSDLYFPPNNSGKNIRSALGFFIAGIPFVKNPGLSFLHFRLRWCSFTWKRSCFAILGEISWERSTYRLKFEHEHLGKCFRNSLIRQCHNYVDKVKSVKKKHGGFPTEVSDMARNMKIETLTFSPILSVLPCDKLHIHFCK